jgi:hypothetical protein
VEAVTVRPGVGCAWAIFNDWFKKTGVSEHQTACSGK